MSQLAGEPPGRIAPPGELVNSLEFEPIAQRKLSSATYAEIAGGDRRAFDRITFRPRLMVNTTKLDLTTELFGEKMFAPILVAPISEQKRFHPDGELAMARGAGAAKACMLIADRSSVPLERITEVKASFWYQIYPQSDVNAARASVRHAVTFGCKAVCLTLGVAGQDQPAWDWNSIDRFRKDLGAPLVLKGIMSPAEAKKAVRSGVEGIVVSNYAGASAYGLAAPIETLPAIADAVAGQVPILIDGGFRRGSDILKAIALGARAVLVGRPAVWGLAAYGYPGVQAVLELLQTELARDMAMCGKPTIQSVDRTVVKIHRW